MAARLSIDPIDGNNYLDAADAEGSSGITVSGTAGDTGPGSVIGQSVNVTLNGKTYAAVVRSDGTWSVGIGAADVAGLVDGTSYQVLAMVTDTNGSKATHTNVLAVDESASLTINPIDGNGYINKTNAAATGGITISGASTGSLGARDFAGQPVTVTLNGNSYTATIGSNGNWSLKVSQTDVAALVDGQSYTVQVSATDRAGNPAMSTTTVSVDESLTLAINPVNGNNFVNGASVASGFAITGTATDSLASSVVGQTVTLTLNGNTYTAVVQGNGTWTVNVPVADLTAFVDGGSYTAKATLTDPAGNKAAATNVVKVDETASLTVKPIDGNGFINAGNSAATTGIIISGTSTGGLGAGDFSGKPLTIALNGSNYTTTVAANGSWSVKIGQADVGALIDGQTYTVTVSGVDKAGNTATVTTAAVVDKSIGMTLNPINGNNFITAAGAAAGSFVISGSVTDSVMGSVVGQTVTVTLNGTSYNSVVQADGIWSVLVGQTGLAALVDGKTYNVRATVTDAAGNKVAATETLAIDESAALTVKPIDGNGFINAANAASTGGITISGAGTSSRGGADFAGRMITLTLGGKTYSAVAATNGAWSIQISQADVLALIDGQIYSVAVSAIDKGGNNVSVTTSVTVDEHVSLAIDPVGGSNVIGPASTANGFTISGAAGDSRLASLVGQTVTVSLNGKKYTGVVGSGGTWSVLVGAADSSALVSGRTYTITASVTDAAGNRVSSSDSVKVSPIGLGITAVDGNGFINAGQAASGITIGGTSFDSLAGGLSGRTVSVVLNGKTYAGTIGTDGSWSVAVGSSDLSQLIDAQTYTVTASATDKGGTATTTKASVTVDKVVGLSIAPVDGNGIINAANAAAGVVIAGKATDSVSGNIVGQAVRVTLNGNSYTGTVQSDGSWSLTIPGADLKGLTFGQVYAVSASAADAAGNTANAQSNLTIGPPSAAEITINPVDGTGIINGANAATGITFSGSVSETPLSGVVGQPVNVTLGAKTYSATVLADGTWSVNIAAADLLGLADGQSYPVTASVVDLFDQTATASTSVLLDEKSTISIDAVASSGYVSAANVVSGIAITGSVADSVLSNVIGQTITVTFNAKSYTSLVASDGSWSVSLPPADLTLLTDGQSYTLGVSGTDKAGNTTTSSSQVTVDETVALALNAVNGNGLVGAADATSGFVISGAASDSVMSSVVGQTVTVSLNGKSYSGQVQSGGTWSVNVGASDAAALVNATDYSVAATVTDAAGNRAAAGEELTADEAASLTVGIVDGNGFINGANAAQGITISGNSGGALGSSDLAGQTVSVVLNGKIYTGAVAADGSWAIQVSASDLGALSDGQGYTIEATATDRAGNPASASQTVTIDEHASLTIAPIGDHGVVDSSVLTTGLSIGGSSTDSVPAEFAGKPVTVLLNGRSYTGTTDAYGNWSVPIPGADLAALSRDQSYTVIASATDGAGNGASTESTFSIASSSASVPHLTIDPLDGSGFINASQAAAGIVISGTSSDTATGALVGQPVLVALNGKTYTGAIGTDGRWSVAVAASDLAALTDGQSYSITASTTDQSGQAATASTSVTVDTASLLTVNPIDGGFINAADVINGLTISGSASGSRGAVDFAGQAVSLLLNGKAYATTVATDGTWSVHVPVEDLAALTDGETYTVGATATSAVGNPGVGSQSVTVDESVALTINAVNGNNLIGGSATASGFAISGTAGDTLAGSLSGQTVNVTLNGKTYSTQIQGGGTWSITVGAADAAALTNGGAYTIVASVTDAAQNQATASLVATVDETASLAMATVDGNGFINGTNATNGITITGSSSGAIGVGDFAGRTVSLALNGKTYTGTVAADGTWAVNVPSSDLGALTDGHSYTIGVNGTDTAGNSATASQTVTVDEHASLSIGSIGNNGVVLSSAISGGLTISGGSSDSLPADLTGHNVALTLNGRTYDGAVQSNGTWSVTVPAADLQGLTAGQRYAVSASTTDQAGNSAAAQSSVTIQTPTPLPDLVVTSISALTQAVAGQPFQVSWTVQNEGSATAQGPWQDNVYLASDKAGDNPQLIGTFQYSGSLAPGQKATITQLITLPTSASGSQWVVVRTDADSQTGSDPAINNHQSAASAPTSITAVIDWNSQEAASRPPGVDSVDWGLIWQRLEREVGTTSSTLQNAVIAAATTLAQVGEPTTDVGTISNLLIEQASGVLPNVTLANTTDIAGGGTGLDVSLSRTYDASLLNRNNAGVFGVGWTFTYGDSVATDGEGNFLVNSQVGPESFSRNADGSFSALYGGTASLTQAADGSYTLTDISGLIETFLSNGKLHTIADGSGNVLRVSYDGNGVISGVTSSNGQSLTFTTSSFGRITSATDGLGRTISYTYDSSGQQLLSVTGPEGATQYSYASSSDAFVQNALTGITNPDGTRRAFQYDSQGNLQSQSGAGGSGKLTYAYGSPGVVTETDASGNASTLYYDASGNLAQEKNANGQVTTFTYDSSGRVTYIASADGSSANYAYDALGNLTHVGSSSGGSVTTTYKPGTQLISSMTDQDGHVTHFSYDSDNHLSGLTYADGSGITYEFSAAGVLGRVTDADGQNVTYTYNSQGLLAERSYSDGTTELFGYDAVGDVTSAQARDGSNTRYTYDSAGRLLSVTDSKGRVESYSYNSVGQEVQRVEPDGSTTNYSYTAAGQLARLTDGAGNLVEQYNYNGAGALSSTNEGNGATTKYSYDAAGNITRIQTLAADNAVTSELDYTYDADNRPVTVKSLDGTWTYSYDANGQVTNALFASTNASIPNQNLTYLYDAAGNRTRTIFNGATTDYSTNALNQYTSTDGTTYGYDNDGNLISKTQGSQTWTYTYNVENQLQSVSGPDGTTTYSYDAFGNRVSQTVNGVESDYVIDPLAIESSASGPLGAIAQVYNASGNVTATFDYGNGLAAEITGGATDYYDTDITGNVTGVSGSGGQLLASYTYSPFGSELASTGSLYNPFQFQGALGISTDSTGLLDMRARVYDPTIGRFFSRDPLSVFGGANVYSYVGNAVTYSVDYDGELLFLVLPLIGGTIGGIANVLAREPGSTEPIWQSFAAGFAGGAVASFVGALGFQYAVGAAAVMAVNAAAGLIGEATTEAIDGEFDPVKLIAATALGAAVPPNVEKALGTEINHFFRPNIWKSRNYLKLGVNSVKALINEAESDTLAAELQALLQKIKTPISQGIHNLLTALGLGCPHFTTFSGMNFDFQGAGEFIAARSARPGDTFQVQMRIEPEGSADSSVSIITQIAVQVGKDRVTFDATRGQDGSPIGNPASVAQAGQNIVWVDGQPVAISSSKPVFTLDGGTVTEVSYNEYRVALNTGEVVTINPFGDGMGLSISLGPNDGPGSVQGFFGSGEGQGNDFQLPDGTVLQQPLTQDQLYQAFANAWRVTDSSSLFDYGDGQTTATFTNTQYPRHILTLADFPPELVAQAAALVAAAGITDPVLAADAEFDYITMGDPSAIAEDAAVGAHNSTTPTQAVITQPAPVPPSVGILAVAPQVIESAGDTTPVTFNVTLTRATDSDTVVNYSLVSGGTSTVSAGLTFLSNADFPGTVPSGSVTIAAGQTNASFTVDVPNSALGTAPDKWIQVGISSPAGDPVYSQPAQVEIVNNQPQQGIRANPVVELINGAAPGLSQLPMTLTQVGNAYTLNLGNVLNNEALPELQFAIANTAALGANSLSAGITRDTGSGFQLSGSQPSASLAAGSSFSDLFFDPNTASLGSHAETVTVSSFEQNDTGYVAPLSDITLTLEENVIDPAQAAVSTRTISLPNARVGASEPSQTITITNSASQGSALLDVAGGTGVGATGSGTITELAPGASDTTHLSVTRNTDTAGGSGTVTFDLFSDLGNGVEIPALPGLTLTLAGGVYRPAAGQVTPSASIVHVGDAGSEALVVTNTQPADGYSEGLRASLVSSSGAIATSGTGTGVIAAGTSDGISLVATFSTAAAGTQTGNVTLDLISDGTGTSGLAPLDLGDTTIPLSITVNNYAQTAIQDRNGVGTLTRNGNTYTLDLGTIGQGSIAPVVDLAVLNSAVGPADSLSGSFSITGSGAFTNSGFGSFSGVTAGDADQAPVVRLNTGTAGSFQEQITVHSSGSNASGYSGALADQTILITGNVGSATPTIVVGPTDSANGTVASNPDATTLMTSGTLSFSELLGANDTHTISVTPASGDVGSLTATITRDTTGTGAGGVITWNYQVDEAAAAALQNGQSESDTFTLTLSDDHGASTTQDVTVIVSNDSPVITLGPNDSASGSVTSNLTANSLTTSGTLSFSEPVVSDTHTVSVSPVSGDLGTLTALISHDTVGTGTGGVVTWNYQVSEAAAAKLAAGESVTDSFAVTVADNKGGMSTQNVTVTVHGTFESPVITIGPTDSANGAVTSNLAASTLTSSGTLSFAEPALSDTHNVTVTPLSGHIGTLTAVVSHDSTGVGSGGVITWSYQVPESSVAALPTNTPHSDSFLLTLSDNQGGTTTQTVVVSAINTAGTYSSVWANAAGGNWNTPSNWASGKLPGSTDTVLVDLQSGATATYSSASPTTVGAVVAGSGTLAISEGVLDVTGQLIVAGGTLLLNGGTVQQATITNSSGSIVFNGGTLSGVTYDGPLSLLANSQTVYVTNGLTATGVGGSGPGLVTVTGISDEIALEGTQTFDNAVVNLGSTSGYNDYLVSYDNTGTGSLLTLGPNVTINADSTNYEYLTSSGYAADGIINQGTINVQGSGTTGTTLYLEPNNFTNQGTINVGNHSTLYLEPTNGLANSSTGVIHVDAGSTLYFGRAGDSWTNSGTITVSAGATAYLYGNFSTATFKSISDTGAGINLSGNLDNSGALLDVGTGQLISGLVLTSSGTMTGGTVVDHGSGVSFQGGVLNGVTYIGAINFSTGSPYLYVVNGLTVKGSDGSSPGTINLATTSDQMWFEGSQTLDNATVNLGSTSAYSDYLYNDDTTGSGAVLTLGSHLTVNADSTNYEYLTGTGYTGDGIINNGTINVSGTGSTGTTLYVTPRNFVNQGTINVTNRSTLYLQPNGLTNAATGVINVGAGSTLYLGISSGTVANAGTITATGATVYINSFGTAATTGTLTLTNSTLHLSGNYTTAQFSTISDAGDSVFIDGTLNNAGATFTVGSGQNFPTLALASDGTIAGGTIVDNGSGVTLQGGVLNGVTYQGTMTFGANASYVYVTNGLTVTSADGKSPGIVNLNSTSDELLFQGTQTFDNATVNLGSASAYADYLYAYDNTGAGTVLTLGSHVVINADSTNYEYLTSSGYTGDGIVHKGVINVSGTGTTGTSLYVTPRGFTNQGTINVTNGSALYLEPGSTLSNDGAGTINVGSGSTLYFGSSSASSSNAGTITATGATLYLYSFGNFSNSGSLHLTSSAIHLYGTFTTAQLAAVAGSGNTVYIDGTLNNAGAALNVGAGQGLASVVLASDGSIVGGTIVDHGGGLTFQGGTLNGVTYDGTLNMASSSATVYVTNGLTVNAADGTSAGTVNMTATSDELLFEGTQTFDNATVNMGSSSAYADYLYDYDNTGSGTVLTLGAHLVVNADSTNYQYLTSSGYAGDGIVNLGVINAIGTGSSGTVLYINPHAFTNRGTLSVTNGSTVYLDPGAGLTNAAGANISVSGAGSTLDFGSSGQTWTNAGSISVSSGGILRLYGNYTGNQVNAVSASSGTVYVDGTMTNTGTTLNVGTGQNLAAMVLASDGSIVGGTIVDHGSGMTFQSGLLNGVTYDGTMTFGANSAAVYIRNGLTLNSADGAGAATLNLTAISDQLFLEGTQTLDNATVNLGSSSGYADYLEDYDNTGTGSVLTLGSRLVINADSTNYEYLTSTSSTGDGIVNQGVINAVGTGSTGTTLYINPRSFTNQGTLSVTNGSTVYADPTAGLTNAAGGTISVSGAGSTLDWGTGGQTWTNIGAMSVSSGGILRLYGNYTGNQVAAISDSGGTVYVDGTMTNTGTTLNIGSGQSLSATVLASDGAIIGGTIIDHGSGMTFQSGLLNGVTYQGAINLASNSTSLYVSNGLTALNTAGTGPGTINLSAISDQILFEGNQTLDNVSVNLGGPAAYADYLGEYDISGNGAVLTIGPNAAINGNSTNYEYLNSSGSNHSGDGIVNQGTINANAGTLYIDPYNFLNQGSLNVASGAAANIGPGTSFQNSGVIKANGSAVVTVGLAETGTGGTVDLFGTSEISYAAAASDNVTFEAGATAELLLLKSSIYTGTVTGFTGTGNGTPATSDKIDLRDISFTSTKFAESFSNGVLVVTDGTRTANIHLAGNYTAANFHFANDGNGGTLVTDPPAASDSTDAATAAQASLLCQYMASSLVAGAQAWDGIQTAHLQPSPHEMLVAHAG